MFVFGSCGPACADQLPLSSPPSKEVQTLRDNLQDYVEVRMGAGLQTIPSLSDHFFFIFRPSSPKKANRSCLLRWRATIKLPSMLAASGACCSNLTAP